MQVHNPHGGRHIVRRTTDTRPPLTVGLSEFHGFVSIHALYAKTVMTVDEAWNLINTLADRLEEIEAA
ncbi:hypothetical protein [Tsukamurella tyrosinosolvens]|uniref:hypothetical protein n=1 Tax=Tsukamurella tyrosinosolvens TaxID=57704 RepID=UPI002DD431DC|nr:hypothetical protein [Tsukamurella tyrosinosolvens]MEC4614615.1 hypothetical protein [Tsukamurella tyrosinosolvens]